MKDQDLDLWLSELRDHRPSDLQMQKWKRAVRLENQRVRGDRVSRPRQAVRLAVACAVGILIGATLFRTSPNPAAMSEIAQNDFDNATTEFVTVKSSE